MKQHDKVCIGIVNNGFIKSELVLDLIQLRGIRDSCFVDFIQVGNIGQTTRNRNVVVQNFMERTTADWLFMIDSDERLELETWKRFLETADFPHRKVVSGLVFADFEDENGNKTPIPTIYSQTSNGLQAIHGYPSDQIIEVDAIGTGAVMVHRSVLQLMQDNATEHQGKDWAWFVEGAINQTWYGEDILFSRKLKSLGVKIFAHTGAICAHYKHYWLDDRHHAHIREQAIQQIQSESEVPLASGSPITSKE